MSTTEIIPDTGAAIIEPPRLLVEWSSPWQEFKSALRPALKRPPKALAGEAHTGLFPYRGLLASWALEVLLLWLVIVLPERIESLRPYTPPPHPTYDVLYYYGNELPKTEDNGGAQAGKTGAAGGQEAWHRSQTIRVARGDKPAEKVVDAPRLDLPRSDSSVANLLAYKPLPGPAPAEGLRSKLFAPALPTNAVPPTPELNSALSRKDNGLNSAVVHPAPDVADANARKAPQLRASVVAPAPEITRNNLRGNIPLNPSIVAPPPSDVQRDLASSRSPLNQLSTVVAPPVSAPPRDLASESRLSMPAPAVVAPPPSQVSRDLNSWGRSALGNVRTTPVPPPPSLAGSGASPARGGVGGIGSQVIPPPVSADVRGRPGNSGGRGAGTLLGSATVVPPPPGLGGGKALSGSGRGNKGIGAGSLLDLGSPAAPPAKSGGSVAGSGIVVSNQPGTAVGVPNKSSGGSLAMSPAGSAKAGLGGGGNGNGIGRGKGPGSGLEGTGSGAGREGVGRGSDPNSRAGISPYPGPGGAGRGTNGTPALPGVSVEGGNTITLPSFGPPGGEAPGGPGHSSVGEHNGPDITIVATSRSGGVFNRYGQLKGDRVYSIYIPTSMGLAVLQYADAASAAHPYPEDLTAPEVIHNELPEGLHRSYIEIACILNRSGEFKDLKVLVRGSPETTSKILAALPRWKFRPAFRGNTPVEVNAILGFGIDTR